MTNTTTLKDFSECHSSIKENGILLATFPPDDSRGVNDICDKINNELGLDGMVDWHFKVDTNYILYVGNYRKIKDIFDRQLDHLFLKNNVLKKNE